MPRKEQTRFAVDAKKRLVELNEPQTWLIKRVREETGLYVDSGYMSKIWLGDRVPAKIIDSICKILELENPARQ